MRAKTNTYYDFRRCSICQAETHYEDPWPMHTADCPDATPREVMLAEVTGCRQVGDAAAEACAAIAAREAKARQARQRERYREMAQEARQPTKLGTLSTPAAKRAALKRLAMKDSLEQFRLAVILLAREEEEENRGYRSETGHGGSA